MKNDLALEAGQDDVAGERYFSEMARWRADTSLNMELAFMRLSLLILRSWGSALCDVT